MNVPWIEKHEEPVQLHSGGWSHYLVRADLMFEDEAIREAWLKWAKQWAWHKQAMGAKGRKGFKVNGIPNGGIPWAEALQAELAAPGESPIRILVDDVLTTGASLAEHIRGGDYDLVLVVVSRTLRASSRVHAYWRIPLPLCEEPTP